MKLELPNKEGALSEYRMVGKPLTDQEMPKNPARVISYRTCRGRSIAKSNPHGAPAIHWEDTLRFRHYLADLGLGIAEAMDTAQRGMGLDWNNALELITQTRKELPEARVAHGWYGPS